MFTACDKTKHNQASMFGPYVYLMDPLVPKEKDAVIFTSLLGGMSRQNTPLELLELEGILRGQDSSVQPMCRFGYRQLNSEMPKREQFNIPTQCDSALATKVIFKCPNGHQHMTTEKCCATTVCKCQGQCVCRDMWLGRNQVQGMCGSPRMTL